MPQASRQPARQALVGWFMRRAGLARFTTFLCALGFALSALAGARSWVGLVGLVGSLGASLAAVSAHSRRCVRPGRASHRISGLLVASILLTGLFAGYLLGSVRVVSLLRSDIEVRVGTVVEAELVVTGSVRASSGWQSATALIRSVGGNATDPAVGETVLLEVPPAEDDAAESSAGTASQHLAAAVSLRQGAIVHVKGVVTAPRGPSDSGYDQARELLHQGIKVVFRAETAWSVEAVGRRGGVAGWFDRLRASAQDHLSRGPDSRVNEVLQGVVMGDTTGIDRDWLDAFRRSGVAHMFSVSGLHVASLAAIMIGLARVLRAPRWAGFLLAAAAALLIIPFVGASAPVVRAAVMIVIVLVGRWVGRGKDQWQILALAAAVVLGINPFAVFDVGFQLSFSAFLGMLTLLRPLQRLLRFMPPTLGSNVAVSLAASAGTAPVALAVFGRTSLVAPIANLLVVPTLPLITGFGMASIFLGFAWSGLSVLFDTLASLPMVWTVLVSRLMSLAPVLEARDLGRAAASLAAGVVVLPISCAFLGRLVRTPLGIPMPFWQRCTVWVRAHRPRRRGWAVTLAALVVVAALGVGLAAYPALAAGGESLRVALGGRGWPEEVELRVLDIGQGNAVLLRTPQHHAVLFDGGPAGCGLARQLHALGVDELDLVVVSHPHADHFAGLLEALDEVEVDALIDGVEVIPDHTAVATARAGPAVSADSVQAYADGSTEAGDYLELRHQLERSGSAYVQAATGYAVNIDGVAVSFYAPRDALTLVDGPSPWEREGGTPSGDELNAASLVALVTVGGTDMLLPGDAEARTLAGYSLQSAEVLVVPHHGSRGAVSADQLARWGTQAAFISVGERNSFGHPDASTLATLEGVVPLVLRTDTVGWVCCSVHGEQISVCVEHVPATEPEGAP